MEKFSLCLGCLTAFPVNAITLKFQMAYWLFWRLLALMSLTPQWLDLSIQGSFWDYVHPPGREGVLTLLESLMRAQIAGSDVFESIMPKERSELLTFVAESEAVNPPSGKLSFRVPVSVRMTCSRFSAKELKVLRQLPIFCVAKDSSYISLVSSENSTQFCAMEDCSRLTAELFPIALFENNVISS